jgi:serine/threonine protein kinase
MENSEKNERNLVRWLQQEMHASITKKIMSWEPPSVEDLAANLPQYQITRFIGRGGMGAVYEGYQESLERRVAVKVCSVVGNSDAEVIFKERFRLEGRAMARLLHPSIVAVYDSGQTNSGLSYLVMEYVDGCDLALLLQQKGRLPMIEAAQIISSVCEGLAYAHEEGVIHRDIKPSNVMIDTKGRVKIADFGLAKLSLPSEFSLTQSNAVIGTMDFLAPEAMVSTIELDCRADLYAVGVMFYQLLTGCLPKGRYTLASDLAAAIDHRVDEILDRALRADREQRQSSAKKMKAEVDELLLARQPVKNTSFLRHKALVAVIGTSFFVSSGAGLLFLVNFDEVDPSSDKRAIRLWDNAKDVNFKGGSWKEGVLILNNGAAKFDSLPALDSMIGLKVLMNRNAERLVIGLRNREVPDKPELQSMYQVALLRENGDDKPKIFLRMYQADLVENLAVWELPSVYAENEWLSLVFKIRGSFLSVYADGEKLGELQDSTLEYPGGVQLYATANGHFRDIFYVPINELVRLR